ncbi:MAG TPA: hypothetical protein VL460_03905 [Caulobacteraceae bacterium]|nr:hypothetical protein [Caulobacteraceae bacterium]
MRIRHAALLAAVLTSSAVAAHAQAPKASACDRRCLLHTLTEYTEAIGDNSTARLKLSPKLRATYNGIEGALGKGDIWADNRRLPYRQVFVDPVTGAAVFYGIVTEAVPRAAPGAAPAAAPKTPRWWFYVARLKVAGGQITEVEEIAYEKPAGGFGADPSSLTLADRIFDTVLPAPERSTRQQLFHIADQYFSAVSHQLDYHDVPWHPECQRVEIGTFTVNAPGTSGSCGGEFKTPSVKWNVINRRFYIADVERGVVLAVGNFTAPPEYPKNNPSVVMEVFKVQDGMIRHISAFFRGNGQPHSGWGD